MIGQEYIYYTKKNLSFLRYNWNYNKIENLALREASYDSLPEARNLVDQDVIDPRTKYRNNTPDVKRERRQELEKLFIAIPISILSGIISSLLFFLSIHFTKLLNKKIEAITTVGAGLIVALLLLTLFYLFRKKLELTNKQIWAIFDEGIIKDDGKIPEIPKKNKTGL
jgi:hypothetical protein